MNFNSDDIPGDFLKKYFARTCYGQDLFYIAIEDIGDEDNYFFSSSVEDKIFEEPELKKLIKIIINKVLKESTRKHFIDKLFEKIKIVPGIEKYYFKKHLLDKYGRFSESLAETYKAIIYNYNLKVNVVYSPHRNSEVFEELKTSFQKSEKGINGIVTDKDLFESCLVNDDLKFGYVEIFSNDMEYYFQQESSEEELFEYYYIVMNEELLFLFLVLTKKNKK